MSIPQKTRLCKQIRLTTIATCVATGLAFGGVSTLAHALPDQASDRAHERTSRNHGERLEKVKDALDRIRLARLHKVRNLSAWNHFPDAGEFTDKATNLAALIQTLDQDGDLNNGIDVSREASRIVDEYTDMLTFDQSPAEFARSEAVTDLMAELNAAGEEVFDDTDPRPRRLMNAESAVELVARAQSDRKIVPTSLGVLRGFTTPDDKAWGFYGIPYAKAPLEELRWKPPVDHDGWWGVREAIAWSDQSAQDPTNEAFGEGGMSEDSLYLNVTVPKDAGDEPLPVMVWFHGGGFAILTGNTRGFNNTSLPGKGAIVVTVNHRLGPFGYMAHPALTEESENGASGNYGQLDLVAALEWVQENIDRFGGDPDNVTIFGESGGGGKTLSLLHSPLADGLFHKAIVQSGMAAPSDQTIPVENPLEAQEQQGINLAEALGVADEPDVLAAMRDIPWPDIVEASAEAGFAARPNIDGWYQTMGIRDAFEAGKHHDVSIMAGANTGDLPPLVEGLKWYMPWMAEYNESDVYTYVFDHVPAGWRNFGTSAYHGVELVYMFDYPGSFVAHYLLGLTGHPDPTPQKFATTDSPGIDPEEYAMVSQLSLDLWASFAKDGDPAIDRQEWPAYTGENDTYLRIDLTPAVETGLDDAFPEFDFPTPPTAP
ncbi:carboxylesterase/lipase family protein [Marinobacter sp. M1N3S26]|uniref:carboxylesterase/lipase family protein n=1 Tax=Marinobacter sp. M1N3S26 TaxID=3382299 RepID=UPI00387AB6B7